MNWELVLLQDGEGRLFARRKGEARLREVCTVTQASELLERTPRQIYRLIGQKTLPLWEKFLDLLLLDLETVQRLRASPSERQPPPSRLQRLFPEYAVRRLNAGRDRNLLMSRVLEQERSDVDTATGLE